MKIFEKKIFFILFFILFVVVSGVGIVTPLLPVYISELGANGVEVGLVLGAFSLSRGIFLLYFGRSSDKIGRKPYIVFGLLCYTFIPIVFIFSKNIKIIIFIRFLQGIASAMIIPSIHAYVGEITPKGKEGKIMGIFNMSIFMGMSLGPLLGGIINDKFGINLAFLFMSLLSFLSFLFSCLFLPNKKNKNQKSSRRILGHWLVIFSDSSLIGLFFIRLSYTMCIGIIWGFLPILAYNEYSLSFSRIGILITLGVGVSGAIQIPIGWLADKIDRKIIIIVGAVIVIFSLYLFMLANNFWSFFYSNIFFGLGGGLMTPAVMASAIVRGDKNKSMGSVMALLTMGHSMGMMMGSFLTGYIMDFFGLKYIFVLGLGSFSLGLFAFILLTKKKDLKHSFKS